MSSFLLSVFFFFISTYSLYILDILCRFICSVPVFLGFVCFVPPSHLGCSSFCLGQGSSPSRLLPTNGKGRAWSLPFKVMTCRLSLSLLLTAHTHSWVVCTPGCQAGQEMKPVFHTAVYPTKPWRTAEGETVDGLKDSEELNPKERL